MAGRLNDKSIVYRAVLYPYRSLNAISFWLLMGIVVIFSLSIGGFFYFMGAWPVLGFFGIDVLLVYIAFRINYHSATLTETITLTEDQLIIRRFMPFGRNYTWRFAPPHWVRVTVKDKETRRNRLVLSSHGSAIFVGDFLLGHERLAIADSLRGALRRLGQL